MSQGHPAWTALHTLLLVLCPLAIVAALVLRRYESDEADYASVALRRFRISLLIGGVGGLIGLARLWLSR